MNTDIRYATFKKKKKNESNSTGQNFLQQIPLAEETYRFL
jgi:hypothetical protein